MNGVMHGDDQDTTHDAMHVTTHDEKSAGLIDFCGKARTRDEMMVFLGLDNREHFRKAYLKPLLDSGRLKMTIPDKPKSKNQKYIRSDG